MGFAVAFTVFFNVLFVVYILRIKIFRNGLMVSGFEMMCNLLSKCVSYMKLT